ncbi:MAG: hypothetical protein K6A44_04585 [bacterium]|nr:hypothetical protein [bacterium]
MRRLNALTTLEAILIMLLMGLVYVYSRQIDSHILEKENYKTTAHAAYSNLNKAAPSKNGMDDFVGKFSNENDIVQYISNSLKVMKLCNNAKDELCWSNTWLWGNAEKSGAQLKSLQYLLVDYVSKDCSYNRNIPHTCAFVYIDSNGANSPNEVGKDILLFYMTKHGFVPAGIQTDTITKAENCDLNNDKYDWGCTAKLLGFN